MEGVQRAAIPGRFQQSVQLEPSARQTMPSRVPEPPEVRRHETMVGGCCGRAASQTIQPTSVRSGTGGAGQSPDIESAAGRCCGIAESAAVQPAPTRSNAGCTGHSSCVTGTEETSTWQQQLSGRSSRQQSNHLAKGKIDIKEFSGKRSENIDECWVVDREMSVGDGVTPLPQREGLRRGTRVRKHRTCGSA